LSYTDEWVGNLLDWVSRQPFGDSTAIIITADHGESFGAHQTFKHGYELWEDLVHVPLLVYAPNITARPIHSARSHIDLAPTILELMGLPKGGQMRGTSLVPELYGLEADERPVVCDLPRDNLQDRRRALIDGHKKIIAFGDDRYFMLFDLESDPEETNDLILKNPVLRKEMLARYQELSQEIEQVDVDGGGMLKGAPPGQRF
jgi:arylsulfatase A-like enzyme